MDLKEEETNLMVLFSSIVISVFITYTDAIHVPIQYVWGKKERNSYLTHTCLKRAVQHELGLH